MTSTFLPPPPPTQVEAISQLAMFAENLVDYHRQCTEIMEGLVNTLNDKWVLVALVAIPQDMKLFLKVCQTGLTIQTFDEDQQLGG